MGVLFVQHLRRALRRAIWVIILEQKKCSGVFKHTFYVTYTPLYRFPFIY